MQGQIDCSYSLQMALDHVRMEAKGGCMILHGYGCCWMVRCVRGYVYHRATLQTFDGETSSCPDHRTRNWQYAHAAPLQRWLCRLQGTHRSCGRQPSPTREPNLDLVMQIFVQYLRQTALWRESAIRRAGGERMTSHRCRASGRSCSQPAITASLATKSELIVFLILLQERTKWSSIHSLQESYISNEHHVTLAHERAQCAYMSLIEQYLTTHDTQN